MATLCPDSTSPMEDFLYQDIKKIMQTDNVQIFKWVESSAAIKTSKQVQRQMQVQVLLTVRLEELLMICCWQ